MDEFIEIMLLNEKELNYLEQQIPILAESDRRSDRYQASVLANPCFGR